MFTLRLTKFQAAKQMPTNTQEKKANRPKPRLSKRAVEIALCQRGWTQAHLANAINKSLTAVNLSINHGMFVEVTELIRRELKL